MELVEVKRNKIFCDSGMVARKFGTQHSKVVRTMKRLIPKLEDFRVPVGPSKTGSFDPRFETEQRVYRGREYTAYLLNRDCFMLLGMRFDTKLARKWQGQFIAAFNAMECRILTADENATDLKWLDQRGKGKIVRLEETDIIKEFVEYATKQGSTKAHFYYKHITNATYEALGLMVQKKPKLRDSLNMYEISELLLAEKQARHFLKKYMDLGRNYKDIYESVKNDLLAFGTGLRLE